MKSFFFTLSLAVAILWTSASAQWKSYGEKITLKTTLPLQTILKDQNNFMEKEVYVEGTILEVCQNKGCWMVVGTEKENIRVEFKGYKFFVPYDSEKKKVRMQGSLKKKTVSEKTVEHMTSEMTNPPTVTTDTTKKEQTMVYFEATGVEILNGSKISKEQQEIIDGKNEREDHQHEDHDH